MRKIYNLLLIILSIIFFLRCESKSDNFSKQSSEVSPIVLIYNNKSIKDSLLLIPDEVNSPITNYTPVVYSSDTDFFDDKVIIFNSKTKVDTFIISSGTPIILKHKYNSEDLYFHIEPGDTLNYSTLNGIPIYESKIQDELSLLDFKAEALFRDKNYEFKSTDFHFNQITHLILNNQNEKVFNANYLNLRKTASNKMHLTLDSLKGKNKISKEAFDLHKKRIKYDSINLLLNKNLFSITYTKNFEDYIEEDDTFLKYAFYKEFLHNLIKNKFNVNNKKFGNAVLLDAKQAYDSIKKNETLFTKKTKSYLLYHYLNQIVESRSIDVSKTYLDDFIKNNSFKPLNTHVKNKYLLDLYSLKKEIDSVYLIDKYKKKIVLKDFISQNKGKVIFIDFWASWCAPCIKAFPDSKKLINKYKDDDVIFVFLSIDKNVEDWRKAIEKENLFSYNHSFLAVNYPSASFYKKLELKSIPRYLIYDTKGELAHKNAPSPSSDNIIDVLNEFLNQK